MADEQEKQRQIVFSDPRKWAINLSLGALSTVMLSLWGGLQVSKDWHYETFVSTAKASENTRVIEEKISEVKEIAETNAAHLDQHITEFRVANAIAMYDRAEEKMESYGLSRGIEPSNEVTHDEHYNDLVRRKEQAEKYLNCLLAKNENCERLRPRL